MIPGVVLRFPRTVAQNPFSEIGFLLTLALRKIKLGKSIQSSNFVE